MNEKRELGYMIKFGFSENFENRMKSGYNAYHNYVEILHLYEGNFTMEDETRIKQYFRAMNCIFIRNEYLKYCPEVLNFFDTYNTVDKLKKEITQLPRMSKDGRCYYRVNDLYVGCILSRCYSELQLVEKQNMRVKIYKTLRNYSPEEQIVYIQSSYNIAKEILLEYVEKYSIDQSQASKEVEDMFKTFNGFAKSKEKLKYLVEVSEKGLSEEDLTNFLSLIPEKYREYYTEMGPDRIKANGYQESKLKEEWTKGHQEEFGVSDALILDIANYFKLGQRYTNPDIKAKLKELYQKHGYQKTAKASDLEEYFWLKKVYMPSIKKNGFEIQKKR